MSKVTYGDYYRTGIQDCGNVMDLDDFESEMRRGGTPEQIVDRTWARLEREDDVKSYWIEHNGDEVRENDLDPDLAYEEWKRGWKRCAASEVRVQLTQRELDADENPGYPTAAGRAHYYIEATDEYGDVDIVDDRDEFDAAVEECAVRIVRKGWENALSILKGDVDGPHEVVARVESIEVAENERALAADAELVLTLDEPGRVPRKWYEMTLSGGVEIELAYGPPRAGGKQDVSTVWVQRATDADDTEQRFGMMELNPRGLTAKGERMYRHVLESIKLGAQARQKNAKRIASATVVKAARSGVTGLVRKKRNPAPATSYATWCDLVTAEGRKTGARIAFGPETYDAWQRGESPAQYVQQLGGWGPKHWKAPAGRPPGVPNPSLSPSARAEREAALEKYKEFHRYDAKKVGTFPASFRIPTQMRCVGDAMWTTYRSSKVDPSTLRKPKRPVNYIHEHDAGVEVYVPVNDPDLTDGRIVSVPREFQDVGALVKLGESLGYCIGIGDDEIEAESVSPLPELYCSTNGKCLYVVQGKREVVAMIWGGALGVFARGIDG